jgi:LIVCS family branched-chain amino acid:cation transporter
MDNKDILAIGKNVFWFSFLGGSLSFFGIFLGHITELIVFNGLIFCLFVLINAIVFFCLMGYGLIHQSKFIICLKSASMLLINIPISFIYGCLINY